MPSPFPGMDPYLEAHWGDIHHRLVNYACDAIGEQLPGDLVARMEERVYIESHGELAVRYPDVRVVEQSDVPGVTVAPAPENVAVADPLVLEVFSEPVKEGFVEIREAGGEGRVITVIEVLSLANKASGKGHTEYEKKQQHIQAAEVNLVEIDLLRSGNWTVMTREKAVPEAKRSPYRVSVWRPGHPTTFEFYHATLRERLPAIRVPLRESDREVVLDLQALIDRSYRFGRYENTDYSVDADPPLEGADAEWAASLLREKGLRK